MTVKLQANVTRMRLWIPRSAGAQRPHPFPNFGPVSHVFSPIPRVSRACPPFDKPRLSLSRSGYSSSTRRVRRSAVQIPTLLTSTHTAQEELFPIHTISSHSYSHTYTVVDSSGRVFLTLSLTSLFLRIQLRRSFFSTTSLRYIESFCLYSYTGRGYYVLGIPVEWRSSRHHVIPRDVQYICVSTIGTALDP